MLPRTILLFAVLAVAHAARSLTQRDKDKMVALHNQYRRETGVAMPDLEWDDTLADYAAQRVDECIWKHDPEQRYGENLWGVSLVTSTRRAFAWAAKTWQSEKNRFEANGGVDWTCAFDNNHLTTCGHYSQQVWKDTTKIGCGINNCDMMGGLWMIVFCEYNPPGNFQGETPY